jgi:hypothetical protein
VVLKCLKGEGVGYWLLGSVDRVHKFLCFMHVNTLLWVKGGDCSLGIFHDIVRKCVVFVL